MVEIISVFGVYTRRICAEKAVAALRDAGFRNTDISALLPQKKETLKPSSEEPSPDATPQGVRTPEGTVTGAASGVAVGGLLGWLAGMGAIVVPGAETLSDTILAAGPFMGMVAGAAAAGMVGGLVGALVGMGIPENQAKHYEERIKAGGILLSVRCDNPEWLKRAEAALKQSGAEHVLSSVEVLSGFAKSDEPVRYSRD